MSKPLPPPPPRLLRPLPLPLLPLPPRVVLSYTLAVIDDVSVTTVLSELTGTIVGGRADVVVRDSSGSVVVMIVCCETDFWGWWAYARRKVSPTTFRLFGALEMLRFSLSLDVTRLRLPEIL